MPFRRVMHGGTAALLLLLAACGGSDGGGNPLLDPNNPGGGTGSTLTITGPDGEESGELEVEAGTLTSGFVATLRHRDGKPINDVFIKLKVDQGILNAPPSKANTGGDESNDDGEVDFAYQAPDNITEDTEVTIDASATLDDGTKVEESFDLTVTPAQPPYVDLVGPEAVAPGVANDGFAVTVMHASGSQAAKVCVTLKASTGTISSDSAAACPNGSSGFLTSQTGRIDFSLIPPADIAQNSVITLTASTQVAQQSASDTLKTTAVADTFRFTTPSAGAEIPVGSVNRVPLGFQWTRQGSHSSTGISGQLTLTATGNTRLALSSTGAGSNSVTVGTSVESRGDFSQPVYVYGTTAGPATITADDLNSTRIATLNLQLTETPSQINLEASPLQVQISPSGARFSNLTVTVLNQAGQPISGAAVTFSLTPVLDGSGEKIFPTTQTTDSSGKATSRYEAGTVAGTATVRVTIQTDAGTVSDSRTITVVTPD